MAIRSILFGASGPPGDLDSAQEPDHFSDLNLDQVVTAVARDNADCQLEPYFRYPLRDTALIAFRHQVFRDLEDPDVFAVVVRFTDSMRMMRQQLEIVRRVRHPPQWQRWFLEIVFAHTEALAAFAAGLAALSISAPGLCAARDDLSALTGSVEFRSLHQRAQHLRDRVSSVRYDMLLREHTITVARPETAGAADFSARVVDTFARFRNPETPELPADHRPAAFGMDTIETSVLDLVVRLHPELFAELRAFGDRHRDFVQDGVTNLDRELRFYLGYLAYLAPLRAAGLDTCYPTVSNTAKDFSGHEVFDLALAASLTERGQQVVVNDVWLTGAERTLIVSGPNQGGKTTLSRTFGQLHYLAALGVPVPGREVNVYLADRILTHYERAESLDTLEGKLKEELSRLHAILAQATPSSVLILNEIFTSTTFQDARLLSETVLDVITELDALCLWVTFIDELSRRNAKTVSMVSADRRTFKLVRAQADGRAHAMAIAQQHGLTYSQLVRRIQR